MSNYSFDSELAWQAISHISWGVTLHRAETRSLSNGYLSYQTAYQLPYNNVPGAGLRADLDPWINYHSNAYKPRSHFSVSRSIKAIPCLSTPPVSQRRSCFSFVSSDLSSAGYSTFCLKWLTAPTGIGQIPQVWMSELKFWPRHKLTSPFSSLQKLAADEYKEFTQ